MFNKLKYAFSYTGWTRICGSDDFLSCHVSAMKSESADVLELTLGQIGKFLIFKNQSFGVLIAKM